MPRWQAVNVNTFNGTGVVTPDIGFFCLDLCMQADHVQQASDKILDMVSVLADQRDFPSRLIISKLLQYFGDFCNQGANAATIARYDHYREDLYESLETIEDNFYYLEKVRENATKGSRSSTIRTSSRRNATY